MTASEHVKANYDKATKLVDSALAKDRSIAQYRFNRFLSDVAILGVHVGMLSSTHHAAQMLESQGFFSAANELIKYSDYVYDQLVEALVKL